MRGRKRMLWNQALVHDPCAGCALVIAAMARRDDRRFPDHLATDSAAIQQPASAMA